MKLVTAILGLATVLATASGRSDEGKKLVAATRSKDVVKAAEAIEALGALGADGALHLAQVVSDDDRALVRIVALMQLQRLGPAARAAMPPLMEHADGLEAPIGADLGFTLMELGMTSAMLEKVPIADFARTMERDSAKLAKAERLDGEGVVEFRIAASALASVASESFDELRARACEPERDTASTELTALRAAAVSCLGDRLREADDGAAETLRRALISGISAERPSERVASLLMAAAVTKPKREVHAAVAARLAADDVGERALAAQVLQAGHADCDELGSKLQPLLNDSSIYARVRGASALHAICGISPAVEAALVSGLQEPDPAVRIAAIDGLDPDPFDDAGIAAAAVDPLIGSLSSKGARVLRAALRALGTCGKDARKAVAKVQALTRHEHGDVSKAAKEALERIR